MPTLIPRPYREEIRFKLASYLLFDKQIRDLNSASVSLTNPGTAFRLGKSKPVCGVPADVAASEGGDAGFAVAGEDPLLAVLVRAVTDAEIRFIAVDDRWVIEYLIRIGEWDAACSTPEWGEVYWHAEITAGEDLKLSGRGYYDPLWMKAHRSIVRENVVQAIGRGRGILKDSCDVIVLSSEECGLRVINEPVPYVNDRSVRVLDQLRELSTVLWMRYRDTDQSSSSSRAAIASGQN
ncbi:hypothetical protein [Rubinisphaera margarita]|uniref:hypothetical protein n=1 Tax=Rubinisphaera margarita TaxID=2909586 RepID=UPI001EE8A196|nr:hypothetical protein [Rubinisphaera margarita]MCG6157712.1 hypothetical protein [Rubinisphaera margarita]